MNNREVYDALCESLLKTVGFSVKRKRSSILMWIIAFFVYPFNRKFMSDYTTTIFGRVYFPDGYVESDPEGAWRTLAHEGVHLVDAHGHEPWFSLSYLFPQVLVLPALLGFMFFPAWLVSLCIVALLLPWPAPWREHWERRGYRMTVVCDILLGLDVDSPYYRTYMEDHFIGWGYYKMSWGAQRCDRFIDEMVSEAKQLLDGSKLSPYETATISLLRSEGLR